MKKIESKVTVTNERKVIVEIPPDIPPGEHWVIWKIGEAQDKRTAKPARLLDFPVDSYGSWPEDLPLRREEIYGEWGR